MAFTTSHLLCPYCQGGLSKHIGSDNDLFCLGCRLAIVIEGETCLCAWPDRPLGVFRVTLASLRPPVAAEAAG